MDKKAVVHIHNGVLLKEYIKNNPEDFPRMDIKKLDDSVRLSVGGYNNTFRLAIESNEITFQREFLLYFETNNEGEIIVNTTRISNINPLVPSELTSAEIEGRRQCEEVYEFLRKRIPGFSDCRIAYTGPNIGIRGSVQIEGKYTVNEQDILSCKKFEDTIAHGAYPIDVHPPEGADDSMFDTPKLKDGEFYSIPLRALMGEAKNLLTVGRCISATFEAQAAIRVSPIAGAIGHGGGAAAYVALSDNKNIQDIDVKKVQKILTEQGAFLNLN